MINETIISLLKSRVGSHPKKNQQKSATEINQEIHDLNMKGAEQIIQFRRGLVGVIIFITISHLVILYWFLNKNGINNISNHLPFISDRVMLMFLGTTTADVFGLLLILVKFLFPPNSRN